MVNPLIKAAASLYKHAITSPTDNKSKGTSAFSLQKGSAVIPNMAAGRPGGLQASPTMKPMQQLQPQVQNKMQTMQPLQPEQFKPAKPMQGSMQPPPLQQMPSMAKMQGGINTKANIPSAAPVDSYAGLDASGDMDRQYAPEIAAGRKLMNQNDPMQPEQPYMFNYDDTPNTSPPQAYTDNYDNGWGATKSPTDVQMASAPDISNPMSQSAHANLPAGVADKLRQGGAGLASGLNTLVSRGKGLFGARDGGPPPSPPSPQIDTPSTTAAAPAPTGSPGIDTPPTTPGTASPKSLVGQAGIEGDTGEAAPDPYGNSRFHQQLNHWNQIYNGEAGQRLDGGGVITPGMKQRASRMLNYYKGLEGRGDNILGQLTTRQTDGGELNPMEASFVGRREAHAGYGGGPIDRNAFNRDMNDESRTIMNRGLEGMRQPKQAPAPQPPASGVVDQTNAPTNYASTPAGQAARPRRPGTY